MHYCEILLFTLRRRGRKGGRRGKVGRREEGSGKEEEGEKGLEKQPANMLCQKMFLR